MSQTTMIVPRFDIRDIPFSYYGSWFGISPVTGQGRSERDLHLVSHQTGMHAVLAFHPLTRSDIRIEACPWMLSWTSESGRIELVYAAPEAIRLRGDGVGLRVRAAATGEIGHRPLHASRFFVGTSAAMRTAISVFRL